MIQLLTLFFFFCFFTLFNPANVLAGADLDQTPPACTISFDKTSSQVSGTTVTITVGGDDSTTGGSGILAINLFQPSATLIASTTSSPLSYTWNTTTGSYSFSATATDGVGNTNSSCFNPISLFVISSVPINSPWIQTTNGDIHSNINISTPAGP